MGFGLRKAGGQQHDAHAVHFFHRPVPGSHLLWGDGAPGMDDFLSRSAVLGEITAADGGSGYLCSTYDPAKDEEGCPKQHKLKDAFSIVNLSNVKDRCVFVFLELKHNPYSQKVFSIGN